MAESEFNNIEKLISSKNFHLWKFEIMIFMRANSLVNTITPAIDEKVNELKDAKAQKIILNTIDRKLKSHVLGCTSAKEMFEKICNIFEGSEERNKSVLLQKFFNFDSKNMQMSEIINEVENLAMRLNNLGQKIDDNMIISKILSCLPEKYKFFITAWESTPENNKTLENLTNRLLSEESRNLVEEKETEPVAFKASHEKNKLKNIKCFRCGKVGHIKSQCKACGICKNMHPGKECKEKEKQCKICKKTNHKEDTCFFRKKNTEKESVLLTKQTGKNIKFVVDSGSTTHMIKDKNILDDFQIQRTEITTANNSTMHSEGKGTINSSKCSLTETLYVPDLTQNLISVSSLCKANGMIQFTEKEVKIYKDNQLVLCGNKENGLYYTIITNNNEESSLLTKQKGTAMEWHKRLGHPGKHVLQNLIKVADGIKIEGNENIEENCEVCIKAKQSRLPFNTQRKRASRILEIIHSDVCGPFENKTYDGKRYLVTMIDDYSNFTKVYTIKQKNQVPEIIKNYVEETEREKDGKVSCIRCDNGGEYKSNEFRTWCSKKGIQLDYTIPYTPELNGKSERMNKTLVEKTRALLFNANMKNEMWGEAVLCATYLLNRLPSETIQRKTPYEVWHSKRPDISNIQEFGTFVYAKNLGKLKKLEPRGKKLRIVGYTNNGYRLWNGEKRRIEVGRDLTILNNYKPDDKKKNKQQENQIRVITEEILNTEPENNQEQNENDINSSNNTITSENSDEELFYSENETNMSTDSKDTTIIQSDDEKIEVETRKGNRTKKPPAKFNDYVLLTYHDAISGPDGQNWEKAINSEKESLAINNTWKVINKEEANGKKILSNKWVFNVKNNGVYKARLVVRGFEQKWGIDYDEIYSPVISQSTLRTIIALTVYNNFEMMFFDVKTAFLYGELQDEVYMKMPEGYKNKNDKICKLNKALYGLKQAPITWNKTFTETMSKLDLKPLKSDKCVFTNQDKSVILAIYVDDGMIVSKSKQQMLNILEYLEKSFEIKISKNPDQYIGLEIKRTSEGIKLTQKLYTEMLLRKFNMSDCKTTKIPGNFDKTYDTNTTSQTNFPYRELVGGLLYLSTRTRPDIAQSVNEASRKLENPVQTDIVAVKKILKYLAGTLDEGIMFKSDCNKDFCLNAYCDSDYANDVVTRRSTTGYVIMFNGPISWSSKRQPIVALSSTEAEFIAAADCCKEILYLKSLIKEITQSDIKTKMHIDNQSSIQLIKTGSFNKRSKHIDVRYHFIHENYLKENITIAYCPTDQQVADILTKPLLRIKFETHCKKLLNK